MRVKLSLRRSSHGSQACSKLIWWIFLLDARYVWPKDQTKLQGQHFAHRREDQGDQQGEVDPHQRVVGSPDRPTQTLDRLQNLARGT